MKVNSIMEAAERPVAPEVLTRAEVEGYIGSEGEAGVPKLRMICDKAAGTATADIASIFSGILKDHKDQPDELVVRPMVSKLRAIFGAVKNVGLKVTKGFNPTYSEASAALKAARIKWDGTPKVSAEQREVIQAVDAESEVEKSVRLQALDYRNKHGEDPSEEVQAGWRDKKWEAINTAGARKMAEGLLKKHGAEFCDQLISALEDVIAQQATAEATKAAERDDAERKAA